MTLILPIYYTKNYVRKPSKTFLVNMNWYRNAFHHLSNEVKTYYHDLVKEQVKDSDETFNKYTLHTKVFYKNKSCDGRNIVPVIEKFVLDALQEAEVTTEDTVKEDLGGSWEVADQDKDNPRVEIEIIPHKE